MIGVGACYLAGMIAGGALWLMSRPIFATEVFARVNYRRHRLPTAVGVLLPIAAATVVAIRTLVDPAPNWFTYTDGWRALLTDGATVVALSLAFGILGLVDDLAGVGQSGGFRGHLRTMAHGGITTGLVKMVGAPLFAVVIIAQRRASVGGAFTTVGLLRDALLISLAANFANLLDRAPGRVNKVAHVSSVALAALVRDVRLGAGAVVLGAAGALMVPDLREQAMLGDAGSNVLGAVVGFSVVVSCTTDQRWIVVGVLLLANAASEITSFSTLIDRVAPLRWLDRLGAPNRRPSDTESAA